MLTATVTFEPTTPENEAGEAGHDAGFTEGSAMQTSPVAAVAWGSLEGSRVLSAARWSRARKVSLIHSKNFHESTILGEIRVSQAILRFPVHSRASPVPLKSRTYPMLLGDFFKTVAAFSNCLFLYSRYPLVMLRPEKIIAAE